MSDTKVFLIQKPSSPFHRLVRQALAGAGWQTPPPRQGPPLPPLGRPGQAVVLWDLSGFAPPEIEALTAQAAAQEAGLVILSAAADQTCRSVLRNAGALQVVAAPSGPEAVVAALEVADALQGRLCRLRDELDELRRQLQDREVIEQAKRVLMAATGISESEAMRRLQKQSRDTNTKLVEVARRLLDGFALFRG